MRATVWGCRGSLATPGPDTVRYGGNTSCVRGDARQRAPARARRRHRHAPARRADERHDGSRAAHHVDAPAPRPPAGPRLLPAAVRTRHSRCTCGVRRRRCRASKSASRSTCRRRCSRCTSPTSRPTSSSTTSRTTSRSDPRWCTRPPSRTKARRSAIASRRTARCSRTCPTTNRRSASDWSSSRPTGSAVTRSRTVPTSCSTTRSTATTSIPRTSVGVTRASTTSMEFARKLEVDQVVLFHHDPYHTDDELEALLESAKERCNVHGGKVCLAARA